MNTWLDLIDCLGWTLLHFVWQGLAIAAVLAVLLRVFRHQSAELRYLVGCGALLCMTLAPGFTAVHLLHQKTSVVPYTEKTSAVENLEEPITVNTPASKIIFAKKLLVEKAAPAKPMEIILPLLVVGWFLGVMGLSLRLFIGWLQVRRIKRTAVTEPEIAWQKKFAELARRVGVHRPLRLVHSALVEVPTVVGWLQPVILLPMGCLVGLTPSQLEAVLAHELAHIRRQDYLVNLLQSVVETLLFYHPAVWWVSRRIREERENCCDDLAVKICGDRVAYARALATLEELRPAPAQLQLAASGAPLLQRIRRLLEPPQPSAARPGWAVAAVIVVTITLIAGFGFRGNRAIAENSRAGNPTLTTVVTNDVKLELSSGTTNTNVSIAATIATNALTNSRVTTSLQETIVQTQEGESDVKPQRVQLLNLKPDSTEPKVQYSYSGRDYGNGRQKILSKLDRIRVDAVSYDNLPLSEVLSNLTALSRERDTEKSGIDFKIANANPAKPGTIDPATGLVVASSPVGADIKSVTIKINPALKDVRLADVLDSIAKCASRPIQYSVLDDGVVFALRSSEPIPLETRTYHVDPKIFHKKLEEIGNELESSTQTNENKKQEDRPFVISTNRMVILQKSMREFLFRNGVDLNTNSPEKPGKAFSWNDRKGVLAVRATAEDLDKISTALENLNGSATNETGLDTIITGDLHAQSANENRRAAATRTTASGTISQINVKVKFVEVPAGTNDALSFNWTGNLGVAPTNEQKVTWATTNGNEVNRFVRVDRPIIGHVTGILTAQQYATAIKALEQRDGVDILTGPEVTTESGRQAQMQAVDIQTIVMANATNVQATNKYYAQPVAIGPVVDVVPSVSADGYSVQITVIPTITEFLGYDEPPKHYSTKKGDEVPPLPHFRVRQMTANVTVPDAETIVLGGITTGMPNKTVQKTPVLGSIPLLGRLFRKETTNVVHKNLMVFVTTTLVNPDGTRTHTEAELEAYKEKIKTAKQP